MAPLIRALLALVLLLVASPAWGAVGFDAHFEKGSVGQVGGAFSFASNAGTVTGNVGASATALIAVVAFDATVANIGTVTATWDSGVTNQAMTAIGSGLDVTGGFSVFMFGRKSPTAGTGLVIKTTWSGAVNPDVALGATSFTGSDTSGTGWSNNGTDTGTGLLASSVTTTTSGDMAVVGHLDANALTTAIATGTSDWIETGNNGNSAQAHNTSVGAATTVSWTLGSSVAWGNIKVDVNQAGGATSKPYVPERWFPSPGGPNPL